MKKQRSTAAISSLTLQRLLLLLLLLLGAGNARGAPVASAEWTMEIANRSADYALDSKLWCSSPQGDIAYGPVSGADTSAPDGSIWATTQPKSEFLVRLRLPSLDYSCILEVQGYSPPQWTFSLPLATAADKDDAAATRDIKCVMPINMTGVGYAPPSCELFSDGYVTAFSVFTPLTAPVDGSATTAESPASSAAPAPVPSSSDSTDSSSSSETSAVIMSPPAPSPADAPSESGSSDDQAQYTSPTTSSMSPALTPAPAPGRKLLRAAAYHLLRG